MYRCRASAHCADARPREEERNLSGDVALDNKRPIQGTSRARRCVRLVAVTPRRARGPPIDYANGLPSRQAAGRQYPQTRRSILARGLSGWLARDKPHRAPVPSRQHRELVMVERLYRRQGRPAREGRTSCLTRPANTEISTSIQRCPHAPTPHCSRSIGMPDRDAPEQVIAIAGMRNLFADILRMIAELRCRPLRRPLKELMCDAFETDHGLIGLPKPIDWHTETTQACQRTTNSADFYRNGRSSGECRP